MDGGTIFRLGLNYGAGAKIRIFRTLNFRLEYRETFSKDPDFFNKQSNALNLEAISTAQEPGARRRGAFSFGLSFTP